jgi:tetratricopeptide (TPR) repeat protein
VRTLVALGIATVVGLLVGRFLVAGSGEPPADGPTPQPIAAGGHGASQATVERLQAQLQATPDQPRLLTQLAVAYLARARETADPTYYGKADQALARSRTLDPEDPSTATATGLLELARHNFARALAWGEQAHRATPDSADALGVVFDAQVELGRYEVAAATIQAMVDRKPNLASLARVSYLRELTGDTPGAILAMQQAATAGGSAADVAYVQSLIGNLYLQSGQLDQAQAAYQQALRSQAGRGYAEVGLALVAAARGDLHGAVQRLQPAVGRLPLPASVALLGDLQAALGQRNQATQQYRLVRAMEALNQANGVAVDLELARFEADHARDPDGDPARAVALARAAHSQRPTILAEDTLGWALRQSGRARQALPHAQAAVCLGTRDALLWYHLAAVEDDLGLSGPARQHLAKALAINPHLLNGYQGFRDLPAATDLAGRLGVRLPTRSPAR